MLVIRLRRRLSRRAALSALPAAVAACLLAYTVIETRYDEVVTPYTSAFLSGSNVGNVTLQDSCILDASDHISIAYDRVALRFVENALDPQHPKPLICVPVLPAVGG